MINKIKEGTVKKVTKNKKIEGAELQANGRSEGIRFPLLWSTYLTKEEWRRIRIWAFAQEKSLTKLICEWLKKQIKA
jgi:hypothetical protein